MIAKRDCQRLEHTYELKGLPEGNCEELVMLSSSKVALRYQEKCLVVDITDHQGSISVLKTIELGSKSRAILAICSVQISFVLATEQELIVFNHSFEKAHSEDIVGQENDKALEWELLYFPTTELLALRILREAYSWSLQVMKGPFVRKTHPASFRQDMAGGYFAKATRFDDSSLLQYGDRVLNLLNNQTTSTKLFDEASPKVKTVVQGAYYLNSESNCLVCYNFAREYSFNRLSTIVELSGSSKRQIYTSRYLIDKLEYVDTTRSILGVSFLYDTHDCQSLLVVLNYRTSQVLQTFGTNFSRLQITPDFKLAYNKSGRSSKVKLTVRRLWNKQSLYMHMLVKSASLSSYGDGLFRPVLELLQNKQ